MLYIYNLKKFSTNMSRTVSLEYDKKDCPLR